MRSNLNPKLDDALRIADMYDFADSQHIAFMEMGYTEENNPDEWAKVKEHYSNANTLMHELGVEQYVQHIWERRDYEANHDIYDEEWD